MAETVREYILGRAEDIVMGRGQHENGDPGPHFVKLAQLWSAYLGRQIGPQDVAALLMLLKISRLSRGPGNPDHWIDIIGYAACGAESVEYSERIGLSVEPLDGETAWQHLETKEND